MRHGKTRKTAVLSKGLSVLIPTVVREDTPVKPFNGAIWVENTPYKIDTLLYIGTEKSMKKYVKKNFNQNFDDVDVDFSSVDGLTIECSRGDNSMFVMIWMPVFVWSAQNFAVLTHEIIHASVMVLKASGVHSVILENSNSESDDEALTHTADHMTEALLNKMIRKEFLSSSKEK